MEAEVIQENQLVVLVEQSGLEKTKGQLLLDKFSGYFNDAAEYERKLDALATKGSPEKADIQAAGAFRKAMKARRVEVENTRKALKEESLREGQTIDAIAKVLKNLIEPLEEKAESIEKFHERKADLEKEVRRQERMEALLPYNVAVQAGLIADMDDAMWDSYFRGIVADHEAKIEAERQAEAARQEAARIAALNDKRKQELQPVWQFISDPTVNFGELSDEAFDAILVQAIVDKGEWEKEQARIKAENERLQKEKEIADAKAAALKAESDRVLAEEQAKAKAEREEAEKKMALERAESERILLEERRAAQEKQAKDAEAARLLAKQLKEKEDAEAAEKARIDAERIAAEKAAADLLKAGDNARITAWVESMTIQGIGTEGMSDESIALCNDIMAKFGSFKNWAKGRIQ